MNKENLLIFSYYANISGACQAEWIDDKIDSLLKNDNDIALISAISGTRSKENIIHWRVPSMSFFDFIDEIKRSYAAKSLLQLISLIFIPLVLTIGLLFDLLLFLVTKGIGEGRWSWFISATIIGIFMIFKFKPSKILTSGGPASAHLSGIILGKLFSIPVIVELQDPLSGEGIGRNDEARGWLYKVEKLIIHYADKTVYVTRAAAQFAKEQFPSSKITYVYPGSKNFGIRHINQNKLITKLKIVHLGSLYATRNFNAIIGSIDLLISKNIINVTDIELINLGHVSDEEREKIVQKSYVSILPPVSRYDALEFASKCDITLLIQHSDKRSNVTIPYKTYDYLNINNHILALLYSKELTTLIENNGHTAVDVDDVESIAKYILDIKDGNIAVNDIKNIDAIIQADTLINIQIR